MKEIPTILDAMADASRWRGACNFVFPSRHLDAATTAGTQLVTNIDGAADVTDTEAAFATYRAAIASNSETWQSSVLGELLLGDSTVSTMASLQIQAVTQAENLARTILLVQLQDALKSDGNVQTLDVAQNVVPAWNAYDTAVHAQTYQAMQTMDSRATLFADLLVISNGSFLKTIE